MKRDDFRDQVRDHMLWKKKDSPFVSTTSSLLWAIVFARYRSLMGDQDISITLMDLRLVPHPLVFSSKDLASKLKMEHTGKPWHDDPVGEYLALGRIPKEVFLGKAAFGDLTRHMKKLLPELADKPNQLMEDLRGMYHGTRTGLLRCKSQVNSPSTIFERYKAAYAIAHAFGTREQSLVLTLMCLAFRKEEYEAWSWAIVAKDFEGMITRVIIYTSLY